MFGDPARYGIDVSDIVRFKFIINGPRHLKNMNRVYLNSVARLSRLFPTLCASPFASNTNEDGWGSLFHFNPRFGVYLPEFAITMSGSHNKKTKNKIELNYSGE